MNLISQPNIPDGSYVTLSPLSSNEPAIPGGFSWNKTHYQLVSLAETHKSYDQDRTHGSNEQYLRRHWYSFKMANGQTWLVYFERSKKQWILHSIEQLSSKTPSDT